ncbi:MAG: DUF4390 domain-containing protein [Gemmatimonadales bacterium]|nr:DUF4390 domain-containing protein [Gemmatimonadales bacterium]
MRFALPVVAGLWFLALSPLRASAQQRQSASAEIALAVRLGPDSASGMAPSPIVRSQNLLNDSRWVSALRSGLPIRLHYRVEVWRSRGAWFDALERQGEWDILVRHEPLLDQYTMYTLFGRRRQERRYATLDALGAALSFSYRVSVKPVETGRYYYAAVLQVSALSDSDLDEVIRALSGDSPEGENGKGRFGEELTRRATQLLLRIAGLPSLQLESRSSAFRVR